ncbi:hypothetical protein P0136_11500 [Lentisphaerota bacterium ZTH]|nr:hypothetical protein JYG24_10980 [Lentisphaerota bacterium]WET05982.1 hypothetical protein P0136_11500 [Lentisphaerota bacterium ZTH]
METINSFVAKVQRRLNRFVAVGAFFTAALWGLSGMLITALAFVTRGHRVVLWWLPVSVIPAALIWLCLYLKRHYSYKRAASYADHHFGFKDALCSQLHFSGKTGGFYTLGRKQAESLCNIKLLNLIKEPFPRTKLILIMLLLSAVAALTVLDDSKTVRQAAENQKQLLRKTAIINEALKKELKDIVTRLTEPQQQQLENELLLQAINQLEKHDRLKAALKQYGNLENRISRLMQSSNLAEQERMLRRIARELMRDPLTRQLGRKLNSGNYQAAAAELMKNRLEKSSPDSKIAQNKFARLQRTTEKMHNATESDSPQCSIKNTLEKLKKSLQQAAEKRSQCSNGKCSQKSYNDNIDKMNSDLQKLAGQLGKLQAIKNYSKQLEKMRRLCSMAQAKCRQGGKLPTSRPGNEAGKGAGQKAGSAAEGNFDNQLASSMNNGFLTGLKGIINEGRSTSSIEEAACGGGAAKRHSRVIKHKFKRQFESFIKRDDIPPQLKSGVKEYFTTLHQPERSGE